MDYVYLTPPQSPDAYCWSRPAAFTQPSSLPHSHTQPRRVPIAPEDRIGQFLEGKLQLASILGTGAYGVVYSAVDVSSGMRYAIKCLSRFNPDGTPLDRRQIAFQTREIKLHYLASAHPNVVSMLKIVDDVDCIYVILEFCPEGDLFYNITERGQYVGKDAVSKRIFLQILDAVEHCHSLGIFHRDLKPENILVSDGGDTVKLADFGLATASDKSEDYGCGSTFYMSPECLDQSADKSYYLCAPNDVWSLGVVLVNLTCARNPWKQASADDSTYCAYLKSTSYLKSILPITQQLNDILARIFTPNPEDRITISELRAMIIACSQFTDTPDESLPTECQQYQDQQPISPSGTMDSFTFKKDTEESDNDDDEEFVFGSLSPATTPSNGGSLTSSVSSMDDMEDVDFLPDPLAQPSIHYDLKCNSPAHRFELNEPRLFRQSFSELPQQFLGPSPVPLNSPDSHVAAHISQLQTHMTVSSPAQVQSFCLSTKILSMIDISRFIGSHHELPFMPMPVAYITPVGC